MRCRDCRSAYLDPRPSPQTIELAYRSYYTHGAATPPPPVGRRASGARQRLSAGALGLCRRGPRSPAAGSSRAWHRSRAAIVDREIRHLPATPGGRLLDVGCGSGAFLARRWRRSDGARRGSTPIRRRSRARARPGLSVTQGTLADLDPSEHAGAFDAVTLSHVIEHLHDPAERPAARQRLLRPGGLLWIATPNLEALGLRRFGRDWRRPRPAAAPRALHASVSGAAGAPTPASSRSRPLRPRRWPGRCSARARRSRRAAPGRGAGRGGATPARACGDRESALAPRSPARGRARDDRATPERGRSQRRRHQPHVAPHDGSHAAAASRRGLRLRRVQPRHDPGAGHHRLVAGAAPPRSPGPRTAAGSSCA